MSETAAAERAVLACRDLRKTFTQGELNVPVLNGVNLEVVRGERIAIIGGGPGGLDKRRQRPQRPAFGGAGVSDRREAERGAEECADSPSLSGH